MENNKPDAASGVIIEAFLTDHDTLMNNLWHSNILSPQEKCSLAIGFAEKIVSYLYLVVDPRGRDTMLETFMKRVSSNAYGHKGADS